MVNVWQNQCVNNPNSFLNQYVSRLKDQFLQTWKETCENSSRLFYYNSYKPSFGLEAYIFILDVRKVRPAMASFRGSSHNLMIETVVITSFPVSFVRVLIVNASLKTNFIFSLPVHYVNDIRSRYIDTKFLNPPNSDRLNALMSSSNVRVVKNVVMFLFYSFKRRSEFLSSQMD